MANEENQSHQTNNSYDELRYYSKPFSFTSIAFLEGNSFLWGLNPPKINGAKVLELGCSFGGNLISQAIYYPETEFIGIDLSESQINQGNEIIKLMGLKNVRLEKKNILDITPDFGLFDYIIVHGIYSWVPDEVKSRILDICRDNLSENGIAYISYNTYPGWKNREIARDIMLFTNKHTADLSLAEKTYRGKAVLKLFSDAIKTVDSEKGKNSSRVIHFDNIQDKDEHYVAHEYLEQYNHPLYLNEFVDSVNQHQLSYIGDTDFQLSFISWMTKDLREMLLNLASSDYVAREQCIDYIYDVAFRRSLICHAHLQNMINRTEEIPKERLDKLTFVNVNKENNLASVINSQKLVHLIERFVFEVEKFTIEDIKSYVANNEEFSDITENEIYSSILLVTILNYVNAFLTPYQTYVFKDNQSYVPERFIRYVSTMLEKEGSHYIGFGDMYNRTISNLNQIQFYMMLEMVKPKTKAELENSLKQYLIENEYKDLNNNEKLIDDDYDVAGLCESVCQSLETLGYIHPILAEKNTSI